MFYGLGVITITGVTFKYLYNSNNKNIEKCTLHWQIDQYVLFCESETPVMSGGIH